ncbi:MAG: mechanosensitive ion channel domain-containing protein [Polyangiales bacterium]
MNTAAQRRRLRPGATFTLVLILSSLSWLTALGQDSRTAEERSVREQIQDLVADLEQRGAELEELGKKIATNPDTTAALMLEKEVSDRRERYRRDVAKLVALVRNAEDAGAEAAQGRSIATKLLQTDAGSMREKLEANGTESVELLEIISKGTPEEAQKARAELIKKLSTSTRLVKYLDGNIDQQELLALDVTADSEYLAKRVQLRADVIAGLLQSTKEEIDDMATRPGVDKDGEAQKQLASLKKQRDALAESQGVNIVLLDEYGIETAELKQGLIVATGKLSQDILDRDVASGLLETGFADAADWLRSNGASLVFQVLAFLLLLLAFWFAARIGRGLMRRAIDRSNLKVSSLARDFFIKMTGRLILLLGFIIAIAQLGIEVAPLLAGLGIAGFIIGFALQDTLSNFASGMMILAYQPFDVGDVIEAAGVTGKVHKMNLVSTMVLTFDNQLLIVPNKSVWGGVIRNVTHQDKRRVDMTFGIGYSDDIPKAEKVLSEIVASHAKVLKNPEPVVRLHQLGDSSVNFVVRPWSKTEDYWEVYWDVTRAVKQRFNEEGISIPFPQRDVHIYREDGGNGEA